MTIKQNIKRLEARIIKNKSDKKSGDEIIQFRTFDSYYSFPCPLIKQKHYDLFIEFRVRNQCGMPCVFDNSFYNDIAVKDSCDCLKILNEYLIYPDDFKQRWDEANAKNKDLYGTEDPKPCPI